MQEKWNSFVYALIESQKKDVDETRYQESIENQLLFLGWKPYADEICHKPNVPIGNGKHIQPDILVRCNDEDLFVIEVKRPNHKLSAHDRQQLQSYMRQLKIQVGVYIGEHIEVFYDTPSQKDAVSVLETPLALDSRQGIKFAERFSKENYSKEAILAFCEERIKEKQRQANLEKIKDSLIADAQQQISESLIFRAFPFFKKADFTPPEHKNRHYPAKACKIRLETDTLADKLLQIPDTFWGSISLISIDQVIKRQSLAKSNQILTEHINVNIQCVIKCEVACNMWCYKKILRIPQPGLLLSAPDLR